MLIVNERSPIALGRGDSARNRKPVAISFSQNLLTLAYLLRRSHCESVHSAGTCLLRPTAVNADMSGWQMPAHTGSLSLMRWAARSLRSAQHRPCPHPVAPELPSSHCTLRAVRRTGSLAHGNAVGKRVNRMLAAHLFSADSCRAESSARFNSSTFTRGSPRNPNCLP